MTNPSEHSHSEPLQHHFTDMGQQRESAKFGMWVFLISELLLFGGLFVFYTIYRAWYPDMFLNAHVALDARIGALYTVVLICSSVTFALAIHTIREDNRLKALRLLGTTFVLGAVFLIVKGFEWAHHIELGQLPGKYYTFTGIAGSNPHIFFSAYYMMTGLHSLHVMAGLGVIAWLMVRTRRGDFSSYYFVPMEMTGLYWHLVDLIWIYLFPLFYLIG
jgi:cytochrome c oxidase subunit 3